MSSPESPDRAGASKHCTCACCAHKVIAMNAAWCASKTHPDPPRSLRELLAPKACNYWEEEPDAPSPMPGWMKDIFEQHKVI